MYVLALQVAVKIMDKQQLGVSVSSGYSLWPGDENGGRVPYCKALLHEIDSVHVCNFDD